MPLLWIVILFSTLAANASTLSEFGLQGLTWIDPFTKSFIADLQPLGGPLPETITVAIKDLARTTLNLKGESLHLKVARRVHKECPAFVVTFHSPKKAGPLGVWIFSVREQPHLSVTYEYLKFSEEILNAHTGVADAAFKLVDFFSERVGASIDRLEAGWLGRYFWAQDRGFKFNPDITVYENNMAKSQAELLQNNFRRFCAFHSIGIADLRLWKNGLMTPIDDNLHVLKSPGDYLLVVHKNRQKVRVHPYVDHDTLGPAKFLEVGKAFAISDYRPYPGQENTILVGGIARSDRAMPPWFGIRHHPCERLLSDL